MLADAFRGTQTRFCVVSFTSDWLYPTRESRRIVQALNAVAANVSMIDHLLRGRFIMGISPGGLMSDAEVFGSYGKDRLEMFVEAIDMVLALWTSAPPYDLKGQFWEVSTRRTLVEDIGQGLLPKPLQRPYPPVVVTAVDYYDSDGQLIRHFLDQPAELGPLETAEYFVARADRTGGSGANFLVRWGLREPGPDLLVQALMHGRDGNAGVSFLTEGRIIDDAPPAAKP